MENVVFQFDSLLCGRLIQRINRFVSLVSMDTLDGESSHIECYMANPGSMLGMCIKGAEVRLSKSPNDNRKFIYTVEAIKINRAWIGCNTHLANSIGRGIFRNRAISYRLGFDKFDAIRAEIRHGDSRFDFELSVIDPPLKYLTEIKTVTMASDWYEIESAHCRADKPIKSFPTQQPEECNLPRVALFPDCKSDRALKHVKTLSRALKPGSIESLLVFMVMRDDVDSVSPSVYCDPNYARGLLDAIREGVKVIAMKFKFDVSDPENAKVSFVCPIPFEPISDSFPCDGKPVKRSKA